MDKSLLMNILHKSILMLSLLWIMALVNKSTAQNAFIDNITTKTKAIKDKHIYDLYTKLWYFSTVFSSTTIKQIEQLTSLMEKA